MDKQFLELEITLLSMDGLTVPQIADRLDIPIEEVSSFLRKDGASCYTDSDDFGFGSFV